MTSYPLRAILHNSNAMGNIAKWAAQLAEFQLDFQPRHAVKSQILADFIAEWTRSPSNSGGSGPQRRTPRDRACVRPKIKVSYSAMLLVALNSRCTMYFS